MSGRRPTVDVLDRSAEIRRRHGLLVDDSLMLALMEEAGTTALATADRDLAAIPGLLVYIPGDREASPAAGPSVPSTGA